MSRILKRTTMEISKEKLEQIGLHLSSIKEPATFVSDDYAIVATKAKALDGWKLCIINECPTSADDAESIGKMFNGYCTTMEEIHKAILACGITIKNE